MSLKLTNLSSIMLSEEEQLNYNTLNKKIEYLVKNDKAIFGSFGNSIGRWHCYWYYDSNVKGYSKGDLVWLNIEDPYKFVRNHYKVIKNYTDLRAEVLTKLPEFNLLDDKVIERYLNALSGYVDSRTPNVKPLEPIFDLGDVSKPIQLAVSLIDNNKKLVSDETGWKKLFVDSDDSEETIKDTSHTLIENKLKAHLLTYHLSGQEEIVRPQLSNYLDNIDKNIEYDSAKSDWYANFNTSKNEEQYGIDYVTNFVYKPFILSGEVSQYQAVRYWKSGWIEHFGTIAIENEMFSVSGGTYLKIPFDWNITGDGSGAKAYERGELAKTLTNLLSATETVSMNVPPKDNLINVTVERTNVEIDGTTYAHSFKDNSYNIVVSPVFQNQEGISENYIDTNFGETAFQQHWNNNFLTNEIIEEDKTRSYFMARLNTRVLPPYITYYATGIGDFNG